MTEAVKQNELFIKISELIKTARCKTLKTVNQKMVHTYFQIGKMIIEDEQKGNKRAEYGKYILKNLSKRLSEEFGKGFSVQNLENMRKFYLIYSESEKSQTPFRIFENNDSTLSWSHYQILVRIENQEERDFYLIEAQKNNWSVRELKRQFDSALYERLALSRDKQGIKELSEKGQLIEKPADAKKDPYILEFLGLPEHHHYSESVFEQEIINKLQHFLLELGKGFTFVCRQVRLTFDEKHFRVDLVFYNRLLKCFVLIDLKIGELTHQDIGQMQMYVNYHDRYVKLPEENKTIGIILCKDKNQSLVEITLPESNDQIFASRYKTVLPDKKTLIEILNQSEI